VITGEDNSSKDVIMPAVVFTDPGAKPDLEAWCRMARHQILEMKWEKNIGKALIRK